MNKWFHIAWDSGKLYLDGILIKSLDKLYGYKITGFYTTIDKNSIWVRLKKSN